MGGARGLERGGTGLSDPSRAKGLWEGQNLTVKIILRGDGDVEKFFDVKITADICCGQLVVLVT